MQEVLKTKMNCSHQHQDIYQHQVMSWYRPALINVLMLMAAVHFGLQYFLHIVHLNYSVQSCNDIKYENNTLKKIFMYLIKIIHLLCNRFVDREFLRTCKSFFAT